MTSEIRALRPRFHLDRLGQGGPAVLLLHGIPGSRHTFREVATRMAAETRVFLPDLLGFGDSAPAPPGAHAEAHAESLLSLVDELELETLHLVGFDFGGPVSVALARRLGRRVRSLSVMATNLFPDTPVPLPLRVAQVPLLGRLMFRLAFGRLGLEMMWRAATGDRRAFPLDRFRRSLAPNSVRSTREIFYASMRDLAGLYQPIYEAASALALPSVVLWGDRDPFFPVSVGQRSAELLGAELRVLSGAGHFVPEERPDEVANAVLELVHRVTPSAASARLVSEA